MSTPPPSSVAAAKRMRACRSRNTTPELEVRRALHAKGLRYFVDRSPTAGVRSRADLLFTGARVAVFIDGCFWHSCPQHASVPKANRTWWQQKLAANVQRDAMTNSRLSEQGWLVLRFWEHEATTDVATTIVAAVRRRRARRDRGSTQRASAARSA
jgi:DNA mismatch endonuclease (patch repair protein)